MKRKVKISKDQYDALSDADKFLYVEDGDKGYKLDIDDSEVAEEMRRARDREKVRADDAERRVTDLETRLSSLEGDDARKRGDISAIERSWQEKLDKQKNDSDKLVTGLKTQLEKVMVDSAVDAISHEIFAKPSRDSRLIRDRVYIDYDGETPVVRVRDKDGKASALSLEDLKKETLDNADYADILVGSKATGSGGAGGNQGGGAAKQPSEYTEAERVKLYRDNPEEFRRIFPQA